MGYTASSREVQNKRQQYPEKPQMINPKLSWGAFAIISMIITILLILLTSANEAVAVKETKARLLQDQLQIIKESLKIDENSESESKQASLDMAKPAELFTDKLKQLAEERDSLQAKLDKISKERRYLSEKLADVERNNKNNFINSALLPATTNYSAKQTPARKKLQEIHFSSNKDTLSPIAMDKAQRAAEVFLQSSSGKLKVIGHADSVGSSQYNFELSQRRAQAVVDVLVKSGVSRSKIDLIAKGESKLPFSTIDDADEPLNRCVGIIAVNE